MSVHTYQYISYTYNKQYTDVSKIDENRCKLTLFWGIQVFFNSLKFTVIMNLPQNTAYASDSEYVILTCL